MDEKELDIFNVESDALYDYQKEYETFMNAYEISQQHPEEVGALIMRMAGYYARYNITFSQKLKAFGHMKADLMRTPDKETGKAMTGTKCDMLGEDTTQASELSLAKRHIENIEQYINALKSLQRSLMTEYASQG
jgi:hypothetical protein